MTTYSHKDENNVFLMKRWNFDAPNITDPETEIELVRAGDLVRLEHIATRGWSRIFSSERLIVYFTELMWLE